jgi:hypothetical protein
VAHGGQNWQDFTTFEAVALGVGGADFYKKALVQLDPASVSSPTMEKVLSTFKRIKGYTDKNAPGRDWNLATAMVIKGEAGMQIMGDWAKGEFLAAGKVPGKDFTCVAAPGSANAYTFNVDSFAMFKLKNDANIKAQNDLAAAIMGTEFQEVFNLNKGSIPVRLNMKMDKFDDCARSCLEQGLRGHRQVRRAGAVHRARHGRALGHRRRDQGRRQPVLERRQDGRQGSHGQAGIRGQDEVSRQRGRHATQRLAAQAGGRAELCARPGLHLRLMAGTDTSRCPLRACCPTTSSSASSSTAAVGERALVASR